MTREEREKAIDHLNFMIEIEPKEPPEGCDYIDEWWKGYEDMLTTFGMAIEALKQAPCEDEDMGEVSDGYHTFNQLYHQRAILFATIVNQNKDIAWKSYKHSDGKYCFDKNGEWFIVGIDTPEGSYTYHYSKEYWDYFDCKELKCGKEWDGHTEEDVTRLLSLKPVPDINKILDTINFEEKWLLEAGYNCSNVNTAFRSIKHDLRKWRGN